MASGIPSAPIISSRGAADTTAGRIYFSTPSVQVEIPVGDLVSPPHLSSHYSTWRKIYPAAEKLTEGVKFNRRRHNYPRRGAGGQKIFKKIRKLSRSAEITLFHILIHCETIPYPNTLPKTLS